MSRMSNLTSNRDLASQASLKNHRRPFGQSVQRRSLGLVALLSVTMLSAVIVRASLLAEPRARYHRRPLHGHVRSWSS